MSVGRALADAPCTDHLRVRVHAHAKYDRNQLHSNYLMCSRGVALGLVPVLLGLALLFGTILEVCALHCFVRFHDVVGDVRPCCVCFRYA